MTNLHKHPTHRQRLHKRRRPFLLYAVERARLRARRWKQRPTVEVGDRP
jgi:hypothetical protein